MKHEKLQLMLRFAQWISLTFIVVLSALMIHDTIVRDRILSSSQLHLDLLKSGSIVNESVAITARDLDYLYRATYFQTLERLAYGFLLIGLALLFLCLLILFDRYYITLELKIPETTGSSVEKQQKELLIYSIGSIASIIITVVFLRVTLLPAKRSVRTVPETVEAVDAKVKQPAPETIILSKALEEASFHWPHFRGSLLPNRNPLPRTWNFKIKWESQIPLNGFNSPVVWQDRIFLAGGDQTERAVYCFDTSDGTKLWKVTCNTAPVYPDLTEDTGVSASTLCVDKKRVYAIFATGEMICSDHEGNVIWRRQLPTPDILYGYASSPLLLGNKLIVQYDLDSTQTIYALDVHTGKDMWKVQRETSASWSSPVAQVLNDKIILFAAGNLAAEGIDGNTGHILWKKVVLGGEVATSGFVFNNAFYFSNAGALTASFKSENGDILFKNEIVPSPDIASPIIVDNIFLLFTSGGSVFGVSADNGVELFEKYFDNGFYASPVVLHRKIVAVNLDGDLYLLKTSTQSLTIEGKFSVGQRVVAIPAFHQGNIIIRTANNNLIYLESVQ